MSLYFSLVHGGAYGGGVLNAIYPTFSIDTVPLRVQTLTSGNTVLAIPVRRDVVVDRGATIPWAWTSSLSDSGFVSPSHSGSVTFGSGETVKNVLITIGAQVAGGVDKSLTFTIGPAGTGVLLGSPASVTVAIGMPSTNAPVARPESVTCLEGSSVTIDVLNNDDAVGASISLGTPSKGSVTLNADRTVTFSAASVPTYVGTATFSYSLTRSGFTSTATVTVNIQAVTATQGILGIGPISSKPHLTGCWWNGADPEYFGNWRSPGNSRIDVVTQSFSGMTDWWHHGGAQSSTHFDTMMAQDRASFNPRISGALQGVMSNNTMTSHLWGSGAAYARQRRMHLAWMNSLPSNNGNINGATPINMYYFMTGAGDKYYFNLGRIFAYLEAGFPGGWPKGITFDIFYEFTNKSSSGHPDFPGGSFVSPDDGKTMLAYIAFARGWLRAVKAFKLGYYYQAQTPCPLEPCWRPQQNFKCFDLSGNIIPWKMMFPNDFADYEVPADVVVSGKTVMTAGPLGEQCQWVALSLHDNAYTNGQLTGYYRTDSNSNWALQDAGASNFWGLANFLDWARSKGNLRACLPEWAPHGSKVMSPSGGRNDPSYAPAGYIRWIFENVQKYYDIVGYEVMFQTADYSNIMTATWDPPQPADQQPGDVYKAVWGAL